MLVIINVGSVWFEHHRLTEHQADSEDLKKEMSRRFKEKWSLK